jgi:hypothetical protein
MSGAFPGWCLFWLNSNSNFKFNFLKCSNLAPMFLKSNKHQNRGTRLVDKVNIWLFYTFTWHVGTWNWGFMSTNTSPSLNFCTSSSKAKNEAMQEIQDNTSVDSCLDLPNGLMRPYLCWCFVCSSASAQNYQCSTSPGVFSRYHIYIFPREKGSLSCLRLTQGIAPTSTTNVYKCYVNWGYWTHTLVLQVLWGS